MGPVKFTLADAFVFTACELTAVPLCHAGWEAVVSDEHIFRGIVALVVGIPLGIFGLSFHWLKEQLGESSLEWIQRQGSRWWPAAVLLAFIYTAGPSIYQRSATSIQSEQSTGRIVWNFEQTARGGGYFLTLQKVGDQEIRVIGFGAHGKNISGDPISQFSGYLRSERTNAEIPIYILAQDANESKAIACFPHPWIPTVPGETFGIPPLADFEIGTHEKPFIEAGKDGVFVAP
jgi:hypothetical protein